MMSIPKLLVACEFSGKVRDAFAARGWYAVSCDLLPSDTEGDHYQGDVLEILDAEWDMVVGHPPCTFLTHSGVQELDRPGRRESMREGAEFFRRILECAAPFVAVENPIMCREAREIVGRKHDQMIQPYHFGHLVQKSTCLWLRGLPRLKPTTYLGRETRESPPSVRHANRNVAPSADRAKIRSVTYDGIARAMADQWGPFVERRLRCLG